MNPRPEIIAIYFPSWHQYDHASAWYGKGWTEWELVKGGFPLYEGHHQPKIPEWGYFDESNPVWSAKEIDLAADHGITTFLFDWYWYSGVRIMEEALERGFLKAPNRQRLKFALMWANHTWGTFPAISGKPGMKQLPWLPIRHDLEDMERVIDYCSEHYFNEPNYWKIDSKPYFSFFSWPILEQQLGGVSGVRVVLEFMDKRARKNGFSGIHFNANIGNIEGNVYCFRSDFIPVLVEAGFHSVFGYNIVRTPDYNNIPEEKPVVLYRDVIKSHLYIWNECEGKGLPFFPVVTLGCDVSPRWHRKVRLPIIDFRKLSYEPIIEDNTPSAFGELCTFCLTHIKKNDSYPKAMFINAWNEWTEGMYLLPEKRYGIGYLKALQDCPGKY